MSNARVAERFSHFNSGSFRYQKFSNNSSIVVYINKGNEDDYRGLIKSFITCCNNSHFKLDIRKTKVERVVDSYKELEVQINKKLDWSHNKDAVFLNGQKRDCSSCGHSDPTVCTTDSCRYFTSLVFAVGAGEVA